MNKVFGNFYDVYIIFELANKEIMNNVDEEMRKIIFILTIKVLSI
jgi:hypothetical protein